MAMADSRMVLVYNSRRREKGSVFVEGRITKLSYFAYDSEHRFEMEAGGQLLDWLRFGDDDWYAVGRRVRVEHTGDELKEVLRIWIGPEG